MISRIDWWGIAATSAEPSLNQKINELLCPEKTWLGGNLYGPDGVRWNPGGGTPSPPTRLVLRSPELQLHSSELFPLTPPPHGGICFIWVRSYAAGTFLKPPTPFEANSSMLACKIKWLFKSFKSRLIPGT